MTDVCDRGDLGDPEAAMKAADEAAARKKEEALAKIRPKTLGHHARDQIPHMREVAEGKHPNVPLPWPTIARNLGGLKRPGLPPGTHVVNGMTGSGKSAFGIQAAHHAARQGHPVCYINIELQIEQVVMRFLSNHIAFKREGGANLDLIHWGKLALGDVTPEEFNAQAAHATDFDELPIYIEDFSPGKEFDRLPDIIESIKIKGRPPLVVVDYLQAIGIGAEDPRITIGKVATNINLACREHRAAALVLSSVSRGKYELFKDLTTPPEEFIGVGKESGEIEYSMSTVSAIQCEPGKGEGAQFKTAKNRLGRHCQPVFLKSCPYGFVEDDHQSITPDPSDFESVD